MRSFVLKTWNCFGAAQSLSAFVRWEGAPDGHRFSLREVETAAERADILCLQELFLSEAERFFDRLPHEHKVRDTNGSTWWPLTFGGSGLGIASRLPIVASRIQPFGRPQSGAERFARKGMLHARSRSPGGARARGRRRHDPHAVGLWHGRAPSARSAARRAARAARRGRLGREALHPVRRSQHRWAGACPSRRRIRGAARAALRLRRSRRPDR
ncbi:MAG: endonuclease/exonuclease/phosphatase family protein [Polyangiaceae bacterium]|nr:endonuclease/exonuclease/phosphatase family protein [Polyangiaceae bacterium]